MTAPTRRERLRAATITEIKALARRFLISGGPQAISLRAIAREMGMTAPAIYRYFPSLDALVAELTGDLYNELRKTVEQARDDAGEEPLHQLAAMIRAFRRWSLAHPVEFSLVFGSPVPGVSPAAEECVQPDHPGARFGQLFVNVLLDLWQRHPWPTPPPDRLRERLGAALQPLLQNHGDMPIEVAYTFISGWVRLYGLVSLEVFDHMRWMATDPEQLFEVEVTTFLDQLRAGGTVVPPARILVNPGGCTAADQP